MKKCITFSVFCALAFLAMSCTPATSDDFVAAAKHRGFSVSQGAVNEDEWSATKNGCIVNFYDKAMQSDADALFEDGLDIKKSVERSIGAKQTSNMNFIGYHHFSLKTATTMVYGTQIRNTFLFFNGHRECENVVEPMIETLGHHY